MSIQKEWLDFLREQYPVGSRIKLREMGSDDPCPIQPGAMGTLKYIDDIGTFHVAWDNGRGLGLVISQDSFSVLPPEPTLLKFYMPLTANIGMIDAADDDWTGDGPILDGEGLVEYKGVILKAVKESLTPMEAPRGIMCWYENKDSIAETVKSVFFSVEEREGQLWGVANCRVIGKLSPEELVTLTDYIAEEASCHWGDNFEQECICTEDKELYVHFYNGDGWSIMTEEERFDPEFAHKLPDLCWSVNQADGRLICIKKGEDGCFQSERETGSAEKNRRIADDSNQRRGITSAQEQATNGNFTDAGKARGLETWGEFWSDLWYITAQTMTWYWEYGLIKDVTTDREGFIEQASEEMITSFKVIHDVWNFSPWIKDWDSITIHSIIDSSDGGKTGNSAYDYIKTGVDLVLDHPEYYYNYNLWEFEWDKSQPWKLTGQSGVPMQRLLIAVPGEPDEESVKLTVKKLEAGSNKPLPGVTFTVESADGSGDYSVTRQTGADGTFTLTSEADDLSAGQFTITEEAVPEGYVAQTASQTVTVMPNGSVANTFTFYNEPNQKEGGGSIRKVDADNPTVGIPGAVIRITSVKLDDGGSYFGEFVTKDGGYILKEDLDFSKLPKGSYLAEEITPPQGFILSSDVSKVRQPFVWDGKTDVSLVFENSSKVKVQLKKVDESGSPLAGAVFLVLRDGQIISTEATQGDGTITVSNVSEGHYEFVEVAAPEGMDCDKTPVGVHVNAEDLQGEQTIVVTKVNHHKRSLTITKRDAESGDPIPNTSFHIRGVNIGYENDVVTGSDGKVVLESMPSGCFEIEETAVPSPWILDANNRKTVWIDASKDKDITVDFVNSTRPGIRILKLDGQTGKPIAGATFLIEEVNGGFSDRRQTDQNGLIVLEGKDGVRPGAYKISEVAAAPNYVLDDTVHVVQLEENRTTTLELTNLVKPTLKILKVDSITKNPVAHAKFQIWRASGDTRTGEYNDLGTFYSNEAGEIVLEYTDPGWFKISELEAPSGYSIKQADYEFYLAAGETKTVQVENIPLSALVVYKYDRVTGEPVEGAIFQVKYLSGASGTGGTVIGTYRTLKNGSFTVTGLSAGAYIVEELASDSGHIVDAAPQTAYISGKQQDVVQLYFGNSPKSSVLISKVDANDGSPLSDVEFLVTTSDGAVVGNANGKYVTDRAGTILIENLDPNLTLVVKETRSKPNYILDDVPQTIKTKPGETVKLEFRNKKQGNLIIHKLSSADKSPIEGAQFKITYADGKVVDAAGGQLSTNGLYTSNISPCGTAARALWLRGVGD